MHILIDFAILFITLIIGVPVPFAFMAATFYMMSVDHISASFLIANGFHGINNTSMLAVLFFILMGSIASDSGIADRIIKLLDPFLNRQKSGLGTLSIFSSAFFGAIAGTCSAAVAAIGSIMIPKMVERGYPRGYATSLISAASIEGQLIPPSVPMILYAWVTWQPVSVVFLSTVVPGLMLLGAYSIVNAIMVRKYPVKVLPKEDMKTKMHKFKLSMKGGIFALLMPVIVLGGIFGGIFTPTESAAVATIYALIIGIFVYKKLNVKNIMNSTVFAVTTTGVILLMVFFILALSKIFVMENLPSRLVALLLSTTSNKILLLLLINGFLIIVGMLMDDFSGTLLSAIVLSPVMHHLGVSPVQFAAILGTNLGLGNKTPPTAPILYLACRIGHVPVEKVIKPQLIFILTCSLPITLLTTFFPPLSLTLPHLLMPKIVPHVPLFV